MMRIHLLTFIISFFDFFYKLKIKNFLKKKRKKFNILFDIGAHHGESIIFFLKNFKVNRIYSFEPSPDNFKILAKKSFLLKKKFINSKIIIENVALSNVSGTNILKQFLDSSSSTLNKINSSSLYYKRKNKILYSKNDKNFFKKINVKVITLQNYLKTKKINRIDFLKIDTEGYEYKVILGLKKHISKVSLILFEHHYDNMIIKDYNFSKINNYLIKNNFRKIFKIKMPFRKTFEYIYENIKK
jgi:FkbM family methyltransferase